MTQDPERLAEIESCPSCGALPCDWCNNPHASTLKPSERGPTNDEIIAEAKRISDLEWEGNEEHADFFGPLLFRLQADTSWFKPEPEVDEVTRVTREVLTVYTMYPKSNAGWQSQWDTTSQFQAARAVIAAALAKRPRVDVPSAVQLAYGLLWHMHIDREDDNLALASDARKALMEVLSKDDQLRGIDAAKMTDARFTGAA